MPADPSSFPSVPLDPESSDETVWEQIKSSNEQAILFLYDRYSALLLSVATHVLHDFALGEEVVQDVFLTLWRNPNSFDPMRGNLRGWLATVARHRAISYLRRRHDEVEIQESDATANALQGTQAESLELIGKVKQLLTQMPPRQREVFEMAYFEGMTHAEIVKRTGAPLGTIKSRIRLALLSIRKILASQAT